MSNLRSAIRQIQAPQTSLSASLSTALSPLLQQAVRLLQLSSADFAEQIESAVGSNPFLQLEEDGAWRERRTWSASTGSAQFVDSDALDSVSATTSLADHLQSQLNTKCLPARDYLLASVIVASLDEDGYLRDDPVSLGRMPGVVPGASEAEMRFALAKVQSLDPAGVGARDLQECLVLQLPAIESESIRSLARRVISEHIDLLARGDSRKLSEAIGALETDVQIASDAIRRLDPRPGLKFGVRLTHYVVPDVIARRAALPDKRWTAEINDAVVPKLKLDAVYADLLYRSREKSGEQPTDELQLQLSNARWTVRNLAQRFATIRDVANVIVERQQLFMEHGPIGMKPLTLRDVAIEIGAHESTVSRATNNKFMATPHGVFELTHFFSRGMAMTDGKECSPEAVKELVQKYISEEDAKAPLSDAAIARSIQAQGVSVARRTVTKYRQSLRIAPVAKRMASEATRRSMSPRDSRLLYQAL